MRTITMDEESRKVYRQKLADKMEIAKERLSEEELSDLVWLFGEEYREMEVRGTLVFLTTNVTLNGHVYRIHWEFSLDPNQDSRYPSQPMRGAETKGIVVKKEWLKL